MTKIKIAIISILIFVPLAVTKAACPLNISNLSISNQTNKDKADIIRLQSILYTNNLYDGPITGYYGKLTETAINNLKQNKNGIVDENVLNTICNNYSCPFKSLLEKDAEYPVREIKFIQSFLRLIPNIYPEKLVTGYYGTKTANAVKRLQAYLNIPETGSINIKTGQEFCNFFNTFTSDDIKSDTVTTTSIFQTLCLAFPKQVSTGDQVLFISQILGGNSPYKYIWNNKTTNADKTFKTSFSKAGTYTMSLKVIDNKGNISSSNCKVSVVGDTVAEDNIVDWDGLSFDDNTKDQQTNTDISTYDKYLYNKKTWTTGWICNTNIGNYSCKSIQKTKNIYNELVYLIPGYSNGLSSLSKNSMIYDSQNECNNFCDSKLGDKNTIALDENFTDSYGWVCGISSQSQCSYLDNIQSYKSIIGSKKVYATATQCNETCTLSTTLSTSNSNEQSTYIANKNVSQSDIDNLIKNPLNLDCEILPREIVKGDPVKIDIINMPPWVRNMIDNPDSRSLTLRGYWSGDIIGQYLDTLKGEYANSYDLVDKNNKVLNTDDTIPACGDQYTYVPKFIPIIYCGDGKCHQEENDSRNILYCRKDCLNNKNVITNSGIDIRTDLSLKNVFFDNLLRDINNKEILRTLATRFFNSGIFSQISDTWIKVVQGDYTLYNATNQRAPQINNTINIKRNFYNYNPGLKNGVLGNRYLYWTFDKPGNYQMSYSLYFYNSKTNQEYLIGKTNNCSINVINKPTEGKYMRMFLTYLKPEQGKASCPQKFYVINPRNEALEYITPEIAKFKNVVTRYNSWPYRDLDGNFISFDWYHLYIQSSSKGGDMWSYNHNDDSYYPIIQPGTANLSVPLIADEKYDKLITKPITDQNKIDYSVINKEITRYEGMDLYSRYYQPFSCKEDGNVFYNLNTQSTSYCNGMDSATSIIFGYQNNEDVYYSEGWRTQELRSNIYSGAGITSQFRGKKSRTMCIEEPNIEEIPLASKRNKNYYSDLTLSNFQLGKKSNGKRSVSIDIENIGGQTLSLDEIVKKGTAINALVVCNRLGDASGEGIGSFNYSFIGQGLNPKSKMTLKAEFDCRPKDTKSSDGYNLPAIEDTIEIACVADPKNLEEEADELNNLLTKLTFDCK